MLSNKIYDIVNIEQEIILPAEGHGIFLHGTFY